MECIQCGSHEVEADHLVIEDKEYPCYICLECSWVWRRIEGCEK